MIKYESNLLHHNDILFSTIASLLAIITSLKAKNSGQFYTPVTQTIKHLQVEKI